MSLCPLMCMCGGTKCCMCPVRVWTCASVQWQKVLLSVTVWMCCDSFLHDTYSVVFVQSSRLGSRVKSWGYLSLLSLGWGTRDYMMPLSVLTDFCVNIKTCRCIIAIKSTDTGKKTLLAACLVSFICKWIHVKIQNILLLTPWNVKQCRKQNNLYNILDILSEWRYLEIVTQMCPVKVTVQTINSSKSLLLVLALGLPCEDCIR